MLVRSFVCGHWNDAAAERLPLFNPATEEVLAEVSGGGVELGSCLDYARKNGGPALRAMSFAERARLIAAIAARIYEHRDELIEIAIRNGGNTRSDAKFDIDGATATLSAYAKFGESLGTDRVLADGDLIQLGRSTRFSGAHIRVPLTGAAVHINAFNFPAWGFAEKAAVALLAGMPVVTKPATSSSLLAFRIIEILAEAQTLPDGVLSFIAGGAGDLLDHLSSQDVVAFTGSSETARRIRGHRNVIDRSIRVNVEADSLNAAVLAPDAADGSETLEMFLREVARDITQKAGQKCTAIRRILVPTGMLDRVKIALSERLRGIRVGDPAVAEVRMGPLATAAQQRDVREGIERLKGEAELVCGNAGRGDVALTGVAEGRGFFQTPVLLYASDPDRATVIHSHEVFGPVATVMPYSGDAAHAAGLVCLGDGGLVSSVYTDDKEFAEKYVLAISPYHGRINIGGEKIAEQSPGPGTVMPQLVHGGPGRAGGGEELGGLRGLAFYTQRTAIQGYGPLIEKIVRPVAQ